MRKTVRSSSKGSGSSLKKWPQLPRHWTVAHATRNLVAVTHRSVLRWKNCGHIPHCSKTPRNYVIWATTSGVSACFFAALHVTRHVPAPARERETKTMREEQQQRCTNWWAPISTPRDVRSLPRDRENGRFRRIRFEMAIFPTSRGKNRMSQGVEKSVCLWPSGITKGTPEGATRILGEISGGSASREMLEDLGKGWARGASGGQGHRETKVSYREGAAAKAGDSKSKRRSLRQTKGKKDRESKKKEERKEREWASGAWATLRLAAAGGGRVRGVDYSVKSCCEKALSLDDKSAPYWSNVSGQGGGRLRGVELSGPRSRDVAILSLRYPISRDTFSGRFTAPLPHLLRGKSAIPPTKTSTKSLLRHSHYEHRAMWRVSLLASKESIIPSLSAPRRRWSWTTS